MSFLACLQPNIECKLDWFLGFYSMETLAFRAGANY